MPAFEASTLVSTNPIAEAQLPPSRKLTDPKLTSKMSIRICLLSSPAAARLSLSLSLSLYLSRENRMGVFEGGVLAIIDLSSNLTSQ